MCVCGGKTFYPTRVTVWEWLAFKAGLFKVHDKDILLGDVNEYDTTEKEAPDAYATA